MGDTRGLKPRHQAEVLRLFRQGRSACMGLFPCYWLGWKEWVYRRAIGKWIWEKWGALLASVKCHLQQAISSKLPNQVPNEVDLVKGCKFTSNSWACYSPEERVRAEPVLPFPCGSCLFLAVFFFHLWIFLKGTTWGRRVCFPMELLPVLSARSLLWYLHALLHPFPPTGPELLSEHCFITAGG